MATPRLMDLEESNTKELESQLPGNTHSHRATDDDDDDAAEQTPQMTMPSRDRYSHFTHKAVEIGEGRSRVVSARKDSLSFITFEPQPGGGFAQLYKKSVALSPRSAKILGEKICEIEEVVMRMRDGTLDGEYRLYLGRGYFLSIVPGYACVMIRKFFRPQDDPQRRAAGYPYFVFKLTEFENFYFEWPDISRIMALQKLPEFCSEFNKCGDESCDYCKF